MMVKKSFLIFSFVFIVLLFNAPVAQSAVGCTLNDPDRDIIRIFPQSTGYKTEFITILEQGGKSLALEVEEKLGDSFDDVYETLDVPYAYYTVLSKKEVIGYVHGINQKGMYGGMQLILATDIEGKIIDFYYQKISSPESKKFKNESFVSQFTGLTLKEFYNDSMGDIKDPSENSNEDFLYTLRGLKKNLILFDIFILDRKYSGQ